MTIVVQAPPAVEPLSIAEAKAYCRIDDVGAEPAPGVVTAALASSPAAGNVDNGAHRYRATFVTADGETEAGLVSSAVTVTDKTVNGQVALTVPLGGAAVTARKIYRTAAGGSTYLLLATIANNTTTAYTDNIADSSLGAEAPSTNTTADPLLSTLIRSARELAEQELGRYLITQTLDAYFDAFPCGSDQEIRLPPLQSVTSIVYTDANGDEQTLDSSLYRVDAVSVPARIHPAYGTTWPSTRDQSNAVRVRFVGGYGLAAAVPRCVKQWMGLAIKAGWDNRDKFATGFGALVQLPNEYVNGLLDPERVHGWR